MCISVCSHTPHPPCWAARPRWRGGGGVWALPVLFRHILCDEDDTGIPRRVDLRTKRVVWCLNFSRQVWIVRRGCGKSVTRHHRQRDAPFLSVNQPRSNSAGPRAWRWGNLFPPAPPHRSAVVGSDHHLMIPPRHLPLDLMHTRGPAEFKHIIKRRKRN